MIGRAPVHRNVLSGATLPRFLKIALDQLRPIRGRATEGRASVYQVVGFLAVGAAGAAVLYCWDLPKFVTLGFVLLALIGPAVVGTSQARHVKGPSQPVSYTMADEMAPTEGFVAPLRRQKPKAESSIW